MDSYLQAKVENWCVQLETLSFLAIANPQCAYAVYTHGFSSKFSYIMRTISRSSIFFEPIETILVEKLIPALFGRNVSPLMRDLVTLPSKMGGLAISNPVIDAEIQFQNSLLVTDQLKSVILLQQEIIPDNLAVNTRNTIRSMKTSKYERLKIESAIVKEVTRRLCKQNIDHTLITSLANSRIIALNKNPGIRPIGIGEVLRRLMGKVVASTLKKDVQISVGPLQTCTGLKSGSEAAVHAMREYFDTEECEGILLIDAENAFNSLNRKTALHNIRISCPEISTFILNFYRKASRLFYDGGEISSDEGTMQGDAVAMAMYALGIKNLLQPELRTRKVFFADDGVSGGMLNEVKHCWRTLQLSGPSIGYFPNAGKTWLITKPQHYEVAKNC